MRSQQVLNRKSWPHEFRSLAVAHKPSRLRTALALLSYTARKKCQCLSFGVKDGGRRSPNDITGAWGNMLPFHDLKDLYRSLGWKQAFQGEKKCEAEMWAFLERGAPLSLSLCLLALGLHWELIACVHKETEGAEVQHEGDRNPIWLLCLLGDSSPP